jgi:flagellar biogenesis protein FliO
MNSDEGRRRILWLAAIGGVLILAIVFISVAAPKPTSGTAEDFRITPETVTATDTGAQNAATGVDTSNAPGFSLSAGGAVSLAWRLALVALVIAGAVVGLRWWGRKAMSPRSTTGFVRIVDTLAISNGRTIHLVALGNRVIVVGATAQQLAYLNELTGEESDDVLARLARNDETTNISGFAAELFQSLRKENRGGGSAASIGLSHEDVR